MFLASGKKQAILLESCCKFDKKATQRVTKNGEINHLPASRYMHNVSSPIKFLTQKRKFSLYEGGTKGLNWSRFYLFPFIEPEIVL